MLFLQHVFAQCIHNNPCLPLQPNCYSRAITILGDEHIIIFAKRDIDPWEELTYDYRSVVGYDFAFDLLNIIVLYKILSMLSSGFFRVINDFRVIVDSPNAVEQLMMLRQRNMRLKSGLREVNCFKKEKTKGQCTRLASLPLC